MKHEKIGFIGLGLIGGSVARAIKENYPDTEIIALTSSERTIKAAYDAGVISNASVVSIEEIAKSDIIFLCAPVIKNEEYLKALCGLISDDTIITDVGSVKGDIAKAVRGLGMTKNFIGGHPMAGTEQIGFEYSRSSLIKGAYYILTYEGDMTRERVDDFAEFLKPFGVKTTVMDSESHDLAAASISHVPHIVSAALVDIVAATDEADSDGLCKKLAAGGFRDITRISSSSPVMWQSICRDNDAMILRQLNAYISKLNEFRAAIISGDDKLLLELFGTAKEYRDNLYKED